MLMLSRMWPGSFVAGLIWISSINFMHYRLMILFVVKSLLPRRPLLATRILKWSPHTPKAQWLVKAELLEVGKFPVIICQEDSEVELLVMDLYWLTEGYLMLIIHQYQTCNILGEDNKPHLCHFLVMLKVLSSMFGKNSFKQSVHDTLNGMYLWVI